MKVKEVNIEAIHLQVMNAMLSKKKVDYIMIHYCQKSRLEKEIEKILDVQYNNKWIMFGVPVIFTDCIGENEIICTTKAN